MDISLDTCLTPPGALKPEGAIMQFLTLALKSYPDPIPPVPLLRILVYDALFFFFRSCQCITSTNVCHQSTICLLDYGLILYYEFRPLV